MLYVGVLEAIWKCLLVIVGNQLRHDLTLGKQWNFHRKRGKMRLKAHLMAIASPRYEWDLRDDVSAG